MRTVSLNQSIRHLALLVAGFLAAIVLLESGGLASWANHLEIGPLRTVAVPVTAAIEKALHPLGVDAVREHALEALARVGWTDDAALADAANAPRVSDLPKAAGCAATTPATAAKPAAAPGAHNLFADAAGAQTPLLAAVPRTTALAPLAGDSMMAVGLSATLMRQAAGDKNLRIVKAFRSGTGLARPEVFNWMDEYPAMLGAEKPDVVIVAIGANDGQGFVVDGKVLAYGSDGWTKVYQERLASYLAMVASSGRCAFRFTTRRSPPSTASLTQW
jgi:hypothetical protein